ncbi:MAG: TetR/AcrR family transcriptional regulator [bacterium]|nr:TetR/AcrR family transcriptional regulator [bacterium]
MAPKVNRKTEIIKSATLLFSQDGFDRVTVKRLAHAVGISEPALYRHFKSKEAIYEAVLESIQDRLEYTQLFESLKDEPDIEVVLAEMANHIIEFFTLNIDLYRLLLYSALRGHEKAKHVFQIVRGTYIKFLQKQLDRLHSEGRIVEKRNDITARCFIGMVFDCSLGSTLWRGFQGKVHDPKEVVDNNIPIYVRGLKT